MQGSAYAWRMRTGAMMIASCLHTTRSARRETTQAFTQWRCGTLTAHGSRRSSPARDFDKDKRIVELEVMQLPQLLKPVSGKPDRMRSFRPLSGLRTRVYRQNSQVLYWYRKSATGSPRSSPNSSSRKKIVEISSCSSLQTLTAHAQWRSSSSP